MEAKASKKLKVKDCFKMLLRSLAENETFMRFPFKKEGILYCIGKICEFE